MDFHQRSNGIGDLLLVPGGFFGGVLSTELGIYATWAAGDGWSAENLGSLICQYDYHASLIGILDVLDTVIVSGDNVYSQSGAEERTRGIFTQEWFDTSDNIHIGSLTVFRINIDWMTQHLIHPTDMKELTSVMQDGMVMLQMLVTLLVFFTKWNIGGSLVGIPIG